MTPQVGEVWRFHGFPGTAEEHNPYWIEGEVTAVAATGTPGGEVSLRITAVSPYAKKHGVDWATTRVSLQRRHERMDMPTIVWAYAEETS